MLKCSQPPHHSLAILRRINWTTDIMPPPRFEDSRQLNVNPVSTSQRKMIGLNQQLPPPAPLFLLGWLTLLLLDSKLRKSSRDEYLMNKYECSMK